MFRAARVLFTEAEVVDKAKTRKARLSMHKNKSSGPVRLNFLSEDGSGCCYMVEPSLSMAEVVDYYCKVPSFDLL